ncbi:MAG: hypothetical protein KA749_06995 [Acidovorax sp.]|nr:hypothetical protein [Acidovorax sp.]
MQTANATLTMLYWRIGLRIGVELLQKERAPYGQEIVSAVSRELTLAYGKGFTDRNLWHMKRFAKSVFTISREGVQDADRDGLLGANRSNSLAIARICNNADRPIPRLHTRVEIVNTL